MHKHVEHARRYAAQNGANWIEPAEGEKLVAMLTEDAVIVFECPGCGPGHYHGLPTGGTIPNGYACRWDWNGSLVRPTLSPSILANANRDAPDIPRCHFFLREGVVEFCGDCSHSLANQKVPLAPVDE